MFGPAVLRSSHCFDLLFMTSVRLYDIEFCFTKGIFENSVNELESTLNAN